MKEKEQKQLSENIRRYLNITLKEENKINNEIDHDSIIDSIGNNDNPNNFEDIKKAFRLKLDKALVDEKIILNKQELDNICGLFNTKIEMFVPLHNKTATTTEFTQDTLKTMFLNQLPNRLAGDGKSDRYINALESAIKDLREMPLVKYNKPKLDGVSDNDKIVPDRASPFER